MAAILAMFFLLGIDFPLNQRFTQDWVTPTAFANSTSLRPDFTITL